MKKILVSSNLHYDNHMNINIDVKKDLNSYLIINNYLPVYYYSNKIDYKLISKCKALILSGSGNINQLEKNKLNLFRDNFELKLFKYFKKKKKPIIAICRGFQLILSKEKAKIVKVKNHVRKNHQIYFNKLEKTFTKKKMLVNSYHNYGIKNINLKNYDIFAQSSDRCIELAYNKKHKFLGLMFHPERYNPSQIVINKIIKKFLK